MLRFICHFPDLRKFLHDSTFFMQYLRMVSQISLFTVLSDIFSYSSFSFYNVSSRDGSIALHTIFCWQQPFLLLDSTDCSCELTVYVKRVSYVICSSFPPLEANTKLFRSTDTGSPLTKLFSFFTLHLLLKLSTPFFHFETKQKITHAYLNNNFFL